MPPRKLPARTADADEEYSPGRDLTGLKNSDIGPGDVIRILSLRGSGIFADGMTVGDFLRRVASRREGLRTVARCHRAGIIGFQSAGSFEEADPKALPS